MAYNRAYSSKPQAQVQLHFVNPVQHSWANLRSLGLHQAYQQPHWTAFDSSSMTASSFSTASMTSSTPASTSFTSLTASAAAAITSFTSSTTAEVPPVTSSTASTGASVTSFVSEASSTRIVGCVTLGALLPLHPMMKWHEGGSCNAK